jgi:hypothetical protein
MSVDGRAMPLTPLSDAACVNLMAIVNDAQAMLTTHETLNEAPWLRDSPNAPPVIVAYRADADVTRDRLAQLLVEWGGPANRVVHTMVLFPPALLSLLEPNELVIVRVLAPPCPPGAAQYTLAHMQLRGMGKTTWTAEVDLEVYGVTPLPRNEKEDTEEEPRGVSEAIVQLGKALACLREVQRMEKTTVPTAADDETETIKSV